MEMIEKELVNLMLDEPKLSNPKNRKKVLPSLRDLWDNITRSNSYNRSCREEESERLERNIFEDKMAKHCSNFLKNTFTDYRSLASTY